MSNIMNFIILCLSSFGFAAQASDSTDKELYARFLTPLEEDQYGDRCVKDVFENLSNERFQNSYPNFTHHSFDKN